MFRKEAPAGGQIPREETSQAEASGIPCQGLYWLFLKDHLKLTEYIRLSYDKLMQLLANQLVRSWLG